MRKAILALISIASCGSLHGAYALLGAVKATNAASSTASTSGSPQDTSGASLLVAVTTGYSVAPCGGGGTVSDSKSNTWTSIQNYTNGNANVCIYYAENPTVGSGHTFQLTAGTGGNYPTIMVSWWGGARASLPKDQHAGANSATGTTLQPGSITPSEDNELIITAIGDAASPDGVSISSGFTDGDSNRSGSTSSGAWAYQIQTAATAVNPTWTDADSGLPRAATIVSFKAVAAASGAIRRRIVQ